MIPGLEKNKIRNDIYFLMQESMMLWVHDILKKQGKFIEPEEVISSGFRCFEYALQHYKQDKIPLCNHFYAYTRFRLLMDENKERRATDNLPLDPDSNETNHENMHIVYDNIEGLTKFRQLLPEEYKAVFDDAVMSMIPDNRQKTKRETEMPFWRYREAKKILKVMVQFLLIE